MTTDIKENPPKTVYVASRRIKCGKDGDFKSSMSSIMCLAWYVWEKGFKGNTAIKFINQADTNLRHQKFHTSVNGVTMFFDLEKNDSGSDFILQLSFDMTNVDEGIIPILQSGANLVYKRLGLSNTATEAPSFQPKYIKLEGGYR